MSNSLWPHAACQASLSITNSWSLFKLMSIELVMSSNHLILCCPLLLPPSIFPGIMVFSSESVLHIRWPKYWSFSFSISPSNEYSGLIFIRITGLTSLQSKGLSRVFSNITVQKYQVFETKLSWASLVAHLVKNPPAMHETWVWSLGWEDLLEKGKVTHSSILA